MNFQQNNTADTVSPGMVRYFERVPESAAWSFNGTTLYAYGTHTLHHLTDGRCTVAPAGRDILRRVGFCKNGEAYIEVGHAGSAIAVTSNLPFAVSFERQNERGEWAPDREPSARDLPVGTRKQGGGTNHPGRPEREGQLGVFKSPYSHSSWLVDVAQTDAAGVLSWVALAFDDPRYEKAIKDATDRFYSRPMVSLESKTEFPAQA